MGFDELNLYPTPEKVVVKETEGDTRVPYERIKAYDDKEFELFIREWVVSLRDRYDVRGFGGAGDKGRDVVARDAAGKYYYYQCKHYDHALTPTDMIPEFGKLVYYTYIGEIPRPEKYYILAPLDIGVTLSDLIDHPARINQRLLSDWDKKCKYKIRSTPTELTPEFEQYITRFDFSIIKTKTMLEVIEEHKKTAFYAFRFGGGLTIKRDGRINVPETTEKYETIYIQKILAAISEREETEIISLSQLAEEYPQYLDWIKRQRERFFSAENLRLFAQEHLLEEDYFQELSEDIYYGIYDCLEKMYANGYDRLLDIMTQVAQVDLRHNLLSKYDLVHPQDRQGICHQLANEREEIKWVNKK